MFPSRLRNAEPWDFVLWFKYKRLPSCKPTGTLTRRWQSQTYQVPKIQSMIVKLIRLIKHNDEERKMVDFWAWQKKVIIIFCHMFGTKKKYTQNMTNVETLPTRKFEMSKLKLIIAGLSLWFSNRRGWWRQEGGSSWKGVGKGRVGRRHPEVEGTLKILETS